MTPNQYIITEEERKKMLKLWSVIQQHIDWQYNACHTLDLVQEAYNLMEVVRSRPYQSEREIQCETCKHKGTRACMSHGYPEVPKSCEYKLGVNAEEAMQNLNGTFIDVWTPEHDKQVRNKVVDEIWKYFTDNDCQVLISPLSGEKYYWISGTFSISGLMRLVEELRGKGGER